MLEDQNVVETGDLMRRAPPERWQNRPKVVGCWTKLSSLLTGFLYHTLPATDSFLV